jgi:hypothetical protein
MYIGVICCLSLQLSVVLIVHLTLYSRSYSFHICALLDCICYSLVLTVMPFIFVRICSIFTSSDNNCPQNITSFSVLFFLLVLWFMRTYRAWEEENYTIQPSVAILSSLLLNLYRNTCRYWLFRLMQKIMQVLSILFGTWFIIVSILSLTYPFTYLQ